jgi:hypothetical protein
MDYALSGLNSLRKFSGSAVPAGLCVARAPKFLITPTAGGDFKLYLGLRTRFSCRFAQKTLNSIAESEKI